MIIRNIDSTDLKTVSYFINKWTKEYTTKKKLYFLKKQREEYNNKSLPLDKSLKDA